METLLFVSSFLIFVLSPVIAIVFLIGGKILRDRKYTTLQLRLRKWRIATRNRKKTEETLHVTNWDNPAYQIALQREYEIYLQCIELSPRCRDKQFERHVDIMLNLEPLHSTTPHNRP